MKINLFVAAMTAFTAMTVDAAKAWDVNNWMDRADAQTCPQLVQTAGYYSAKYYSTGNQKFKELAANTIGKAKSKGCK
jgi:hypothetical protein